ncbi:hypothetical protein DFH07DRAFT_971770 [Mycena maculata]|uniref:Uncharacterized protein n=1 Tax=Mycena maculata TaxID=230809 RepID=A0AAD7HLZ8_9AGAR|nr:hypothetical protein DFH07DRAFT_971770 [Mycena maculata]
MISGTDCKRDDIRPVTRVAEAHALFNKWQRWDDPTWVIKELSVWSEIHRIGSSGQDWKGKEWSEKWAEEILALVAKWTPSSDLTLERKQQVALSLRRLSQRDKISAPMSKRLTSAALRLGDSSDLPPELLINPDRLKDAKGTEEERAGGSSVVRFGHYKVYEKWERVAIKEFHFDKKQYTEIKPRFSLEAFTWRELSKQDNHFIVKFSGAEISDTNLRLISRQMEHGNIVNIFDIEHAHPVD